MIEHCIDMVADIAYKKYVKAEMLKEAIRSNGLYDTFDFHADYTCNKVESHLRYIQITDEEIADISEYDFKVIYFTDADCFGDAEHIGEQYYVGEQYYDATVNKLKEDLVKDKNAIWSTISVSEVGLGDERRFEIKYKRINPNDIKKLLKTDKMLTESNDSKEHSDSEICDISNITMSDGTNYKISELITYDKDYLYLPIDFGNVNFPRILRIKIPLKTLKEALGQVE